MPKLLENLTVFSPAKVNLHLVIKDKRPDGFHNLESLFLAVDFGDEIHFEEFTTEYCNKSCLEFHGGRGEDEVKVEGAAPIPENIIFRAIKLFKERSGFSRRLKIRVEKRIPIGGGLGGGSSNAAATLLTLNKLAGFPFGQENQGRQALLEMAASLGSDVPFFIHETGAAWVTGRGEKIEPIEVPPVFLVLVNPGFPSATSMAFRLLDQYRSQNFHTETQRIQRHGAVIPNLFSVPSCPPCLRVMKWGNVDFRNDFIEVFPQREKSIYYEIISQLMGLGAEFASLSGAGASCFGVFSQKELAMKAVEVLKGKWEFVQHCNSFNY